MLISMFLLLHLQKSLPKAKALIIAVFSFLYLL